MPRGVHHETVLKSQATDHAGNIIERIWADLDDEGNELATHVEVSGDHPSPPVAPQPLGPLIHRYRISARHTAWSIAAGAVGTGVIEALIHWH